MTLITNTLSTKLLLSLVLLMFLSVANADRDEDTLVLDVDASGTVTPLTDGLMILRSMFGFTDDALTNAAVDLTNCQDCDSEEIEKYIADVRGLTFGKINSVDDQNISGSALNGTTLTIGIENGDSESVDLSGLIDGVGVTSSQASAITANTAKTGITSDQASAITANTAKTGITSDQASAITANTAKTGITSDQASAITANTAKTGITTDQASAITANTAKTSITTDQAGAITANTAKTGITSDQAVLLRLTLRRPVLLLTKRTPITANTAKVGITTDQADAITANTAKTGITSDQADAITANTAKTGITAEQANAIAINTSKSSTDDQNISGSGLSGTTLTIGIEGGNSETVNLSSLQDGIGTDDQNISGSSLTGTTLTIGIEGGSSETVNLSSLQGFAGDWQTSTLYSKGQMVFHRRKPYWALLAHSGTEPDTEVFSCSSWNAAESLNWIGIAGAPSSSCTWTGGTSSNYRGDDGVAFTSYGSLNSVANMANSSDSSVLVTTGQGLTITSFKVIVNVGWDHVNFNPIGGVEL